MASGRVRPEITLLSPDGIKEFTAKWVGNSFNIVKKLGKFAYDGINGEVVDDYGLNSRTFATELIFDNPDTYDVDAVEFMDTMKQRGAWSINHPTKGLIEAQPVDVVEQDQPVRDTNRIVTTVNWIEPIDPVTLVTFVEYWGEVGVSTNEFTDSLINQFDYDGYTVKDSTDIAAVSNAVNRDSRNILDKIASFDDKVFKKMTTIQNDIQETIHQGVFKPLALMGQIKDTLMFPFYAVTDYKARMDAAKAMFQTIFTIDTGFFGSKWGAKAKENSYGSLMASACEIARTAKYGEDIKLKSEAFGVITDLNDLAELMISDLENEQQKMSGRLLKDRYIALEDTYEPMRRMIASTIQYVMSRFFDLKTAVEITLDRDRTPMDVAIEAYGTMGDGDENWRFFLDSNDISRDRIYLLPQGTKVMIYR